MHDSWKTIGQEVEVSLEAWRQRVEKKVAARVANGEIAIERHPESLLDRRARLWHALCPDDMQETDKGRLPCLSEQIHQVLFHPVLAESLRLVGVSGAGKTRLCWLLLEKEFFHGASMACMDFQEFAARASDAYREGQETAFFRGLMVPDVVFVDDIGKTRMTQRVAEALFTLVDRRRNARRTLLFTMNYRLDTLAEKMKRDEIDPETVEAIRRRIEEQFTSIAITKKPTQ